MTITKILNQIIKDGHVNQLMAKFIMQEIMTLRGDLNKWLNKFIMTNIKM